ncbi:hypothetical protein PRIPAC_97730 [Pristionchus pacificus]|uniref:G protein-coupled receptor n=1 Tax=Pristionchus pacificus TaxID=54126 RepID=A0A2A6BY07_PRIPA|nr:hypothetical protein PRIPAC_97730 [Pristionchus pacificus]|eukprot:PDM70651.1 G protein-coupled receptor [Pristionchus pacificus]
MVLLYIPPAAVSIAFTFTQADFEIVHQFLLKNAPSYLSEPGALTVHLGMTFQLIFTILYLVLPPCPAYAIIMTLRRKILTKLTQHSMDMSERTKKMHGNLVKALTVHAMLPPIKCIGVVMYAILFFDIYHDAALEKAIFTEIAIPPAVGAFCTTYYVKPYRRFVFCQSPPNFVTSAVPVSGVL